MAAAKTTAEKLAVKPGARVWTSDPDRFALVGALPAGAEVVGGLTGADVAVFFVDDAASTTALLTGAGDDLIKTPTVWVCYRKANKGTDVNRDSLWPLVVPFGLRPNSQIALDETWSALRFRALRPGEEPFAGGAGKA